MEDGTPAEVIEVLEELSLSDIDEDNKRQITEVVDRYLAGWQPFENTSWLSKSYGMNYDELMSELRSIIDNR